MQGLGLTHYNSSVQVFAAPEGARILWISDFLPDEAAGELDAAMEAGAQAMRTTLDRAARPDQRGFALQTTSRPKQ